MNLVPRDSWLDMDKVFESFFAPSATGEKGQVGFFTPRVDITEKKDHYEIQAELPGVRKEDLKVDVHNGVLTIEASHEEEKTEEEEGRVIRKERRTGRFSRQFNLGEDVHDEDIQANFTDGVLKLRVPKLAEQKSGPRRIEIG